MNGFRLTKAGIRARFDRRTADTLATLARQLAALIADRPDTGEDPAIDRLLPDGYREAPEDAAEFRRFTERELADGKIADALAMAELLDPGDRADPVTVVLDADQAFRWLRSLNDLRLVLGERLAIGDDGYPTEVDEDTAAVFALYGALTELQNDLVAAVDR